MPAFLSLRQAIEEHVPDGASVALEGFTHLIPFAAGHEVIRQGKRDLTLIRMTPDLIYDQMADATGWPIRLAEHVEQTPAPTVTELEALRDLQARTARAHGTATEHDASG